MKKYFLINISTPFFGSPRQIIINLFQSFLENSDLIRFSNLNYIAMHLLKRKFKFLMTGFFILFLLNNSYSNEKVNFRHLNSKTSGSNSDTLNIPFRAGSITIDGNGDETMWQGIDSIPIENLVYGLIDDTEDLSAWYKVCWDLDSLYILINVTDDSLDDESTIDWWQKDGCSVFLDMNNSHGETYDENDWQFSFIWESDEPILSRSFEGLNFAFHTNVLNSGYELEIAFSLNDLGYPFDEFIGIDCRITDNDGLTSRDANIYWHSIEDQNWANPGYNGYGHLIDYDLHIPDQTSDTLNIPFRAGSITIDGSGDETMWQGIDTISIENLVYGLIDDTEDLSAWYKVCWDLDSLYILINVTDDSLDDESTINWWQKDGCSVFLDMNNSHGETYDENDWQFSFIWESDEPILSRSFEGLNFAFHTNDSNSGYELEVALALKELGYPFNEFIGIDCRITDNDGLTSRDANIYWHSIEDQNWANPGYNGYGHLMDYDLHIPHPVAVTGLPEYVCGTSETDITVDLFNFGSTVINQFDIIYAINGDTIDPETAMVTINPGDTIEYTFTTKADLSISGRYNLYVSPLLDDGKPAAYLSASTELYVYGENQFDAWKTYNVCNGRSVNKVRNLTINSKGNIWITGGPAEKLNPVTEEYTSYDTINSSMSNNRSTDILEDHSGNMWVALDLDNGIVTMYDTVTKTWSSNNPDNIHVLSMFEDSRDNLWFGTWEHGIRKYNPNTITWETFTVENSGLANNTIFKGGIMEDSLGNMWFGTLGGLCKFDGADWTVYNSGNSGLPYEQITCSIMDSKGNIWMGFAWNSVGLCKFDGTNWTTYHKGNSGIISEYINVIYEDDQGNIWCGSNSGISKFDGTQWSDFHSGNSGLFANDVTAIVEDNEGNMWFGTENGLFKYNISNLQSADTLEIPYTSLPMILDGESNEPVWQEIEPKFLNKIGWGNPGDVSDLSAWFKTCWDIDSLYFFINVTDDFLDNDSVVPWWVLDNIELYFDMYNNHTKNNDENDSRLGIVWEKQSIDASKAFPGVRYVNKTNEGLDGYTLEIAIPIQELIFPIYGIFGFDIRVTDNDYQEQADAGIFWNSKSNDNYMNPSANGYARLLDFSENIPDEAIAVVSLPEYICGTAETDITVSLYNFGAQTINQFDIFYAIGGDTILPERAMVTINPGDTLEYTFATKADIQATGRFDLYVSTFLDSGNSRANISKSRWLWFYGETETAEGWKLYTACNGRSVNSAWNMITDSNGNIWIAAEKAEKFNPATEEFISYDSGNSGMSINKAHDILEDHSGNIWIALDLDEGIVTMYDTVTKTWSSNNPDNIHVLSMFEDSQDNLWFGTWDHGVRKFNPYTETWDTFTVENSGLASNIIYKRGIMEDSLGNMWFGTAGDWGDVGGLCKFDGVNWTVYNTGNSSIPNNQIVCSIMDSNDNIWMGFSWNEVGLCKFDGTNWTTYNTSNSEIPSNFVNIIYEDDQGHIWCGTGNGVSEFDGINWTSYNSDNSGLTVNNVVSIVQDAKGDMWFGTVNGLFKFDDGLIGAPAIPQHLTATPDIKQITLSWDPNSESDLSKYYIYRDISSPAVTLYDSVMVRSPLDTFYVDGGLNTLQDYFYRITAADKYMNESGFSNEVNEAPDFTPFELDSFALISLYNSTGGDSWTNHSNWKTGRVTTWYGVTVENGRVTRIQLNGNNLVGTIPPEIGLADTLIYLYLHGNLLSGSIPPEIGNLSYLKYLFIQSNHLSGAIPPEIGNMISLINLYLYSNQLSGFIPSEIGNLTSLQRLYINDNQLSGSVPDEIINLENLESLLIYNNEFIGLPDLSALMLLENLRIQNNRFTFEDVEPNIGVPLIDFIYSPQDSVGVKIDTTVCDKTIYTLSVSVGGTNNEYQWKKDNVDISGATNSDYVLNPVNKEDEGSYICEITNTVATLLTLYSQPVNITVNNCSPPEKLLISDTIFATSTCLNAFDTISIAGDESEVVVATGVSLELIAGMSVIILPGFHAESGSFFNASITTDSTFCDGGSGGSFVEQPVEKSKEVKPLFEKQAIIQGDKSVKLYPNPNNGQFVLELTNAGSNTIIRVYNMVGSIIYESKATNQSNHKINLSGIKSGIYIVKVNDQKKQFTKKIIIR
jgi:ligand-binding sensor domain-containing protein